MIQNKTPIEQFKSIYKGNLVDTLFNDVPCIIVSLLTATFSFEKTYPMLRTREEFNSNNHLHHKDSYCTLKEANRVIRALFDVNKYIYYKRSERKKLKDLELEGINIICCKGHYISTNDNEYYSFFNNDNDEVIAIWKLNNFKCKGQNKEVLEENE